MIYLKSAYIHCPVHLSGTNLTGQTSRVDTAKYPTATLIYNKEESVLYVYFGKEMAAIPAASVGPMVPYEVDAFGAVPKPYISPKKSDVKAPETATPALVLKKPARPSAQVSTPTSHVFETRK